MQKNKPQKIIEKIRDDYDLIATEWDLSRNRASKLKIDLISEIETKNKVLDIGCGNGLMAPFILEKGAFYFGLDISGNLIKIARKKYAKEIKNGQTNFFAGQATDLPFENKEFDFIISFAALHHIPSEELRKKFFEEIKRISKPSAKVKITVWNLLSDWANDRFNIASQLAGKQSGDVVVPWKATKGKIVDRYMHQFSREELLLLAKNAGFKNIKIDFFNRAGELTENGEEMVLEMEK
ncbi:MAG: class I SAM-dependent methyltransferase [Candidatus Andersenbacteria bacterium]|nr:class I SAM-dependent methyltransferase [Candidatus Andersenbacteria bacterium]